MSRRRRMTVAFEQVETREMRHFRHAWTQMSVDDILAEPRRPGLGAYWCAADKPDAIPVKPVGRTTEVPEDARCETCGIGIRELQASMTEMVESVERRVAGS